MKWSDYYNMNKDRIKSLKDYFSCFLEWATTYNKTPEDMDN